MASEGSVTGAGADGAVGLPELRAMMQEGRHADVLRDIDQLDITERRSGKVLMLQARALTEAGRTVEALAALDAAERKSVPEPNILGLRRQLQVMTEDWAGLAITLARMAELEPQDSALRTAIVRNLMALGRGEEAQIAASEVVRMAPKDPAAYSLVLTVAARFGHVDAMVAGVRAALDNLDDGKPPSNLEHLRMLPADKVGDLTARVRARWPSVLTARTETRTPMAPEGGWKRPLVTNSGGMISVSPAGDNDITVVHFRGLAEGTFERALIFDSYAASAGCSAIYVEDINRDMYAPVDRTDDPTTALLRREIARLDTRYLITVGASIGALAALHFGLALEADRIVSLSGPTTGHPEHRVAMGDRRAPMLIANLVRQFPLEKLDFGNLMQRAAADPTRKPFRMDMYYGADRLTDRRHAERVAHIPGVRLFPIENYAEHQALNGLIERGRVGELFSV